jgi:hypothetical protein
MSQAQRPRRYRIDRIETSVGTRYVAAVPQRLPMREAPHRDEPLYWAVNP